MPRITAFTVAPEADAAFVAAWERARDDAAVLHRAWRADVDFRFVDVTATESSAMDLGVASETALYEIVHEDGVVDEAGGTILIRPFEVPAGRDDEFLARWHRARDAVADQRGYLGTRLHRATDGAASLRFVDVARWSSPLMFARATGRPAFHDAAAQIDFPSHPALYAVVRGAI